MGTSLLSYGPTFVIGSRLWRIRGRLACDIGYRLFSMGTPNAGLDLVATKPLQLMSRDSFNKFANSNGTIKHNAENIVDSLGFDDNDRYLGAQALYTIMHGEGWVSDRCELGRLLGDGTFGYVFADKCNAEHVIKDSRMDLSWNLAREIATLKALEDLKSAHIPRIVKYGPTIDVPVGSGIRKVPSGTLSPQAKPFPPSDWKQIGKLGLCLFAVVEQIHGREIAHNDISKQNVLEIHDRENGEQVPLLIDFSCATTMTTEKLGFSGHPDYVHRSIHANKPWYPCPFHDITALGYLVFTWCNNGTTPWPCLYHPEMVLAGQRLEHAKKMVKSTFSVQNNKRSGKEASQEPKSPQHLLEGWAELFEEEVQLKSDLENIFCHWIDQDLRLQEEGVPR